VASERLGVAPLFLQELPAIMSAWLSSGIPQKIAVGCKQCVVLCQRANCHNLAVAAGWAYIVNKWLQKPRPVWLIHVLVYCLKVFCRHDLRVTRLRKQTPTGQAAALS